MEQLDRDAMPLAGEATTEARRQAQTRLWRDRSFLWRRTTSRGSETCPVISDAAVEAALDAEQFDEVIVSTPPKRASRWLHLDLPSKVARAGLPVTTVTTTVVVVSPSALQEKASPW